MDNKEKALEYHSQGRAGKIKILPAKNHTSQDDLSLAYSPGVAYVSQEIEENKDLVYDYTLKGNLVGIVTNGTAVLGLGNVGTLASKPVMEGKAMLFNVLADVDAIDIEIEETDPKRFADVVEAISPTFGAINIEDVKAPECFEIEKELKKRLNIPVMHDDQHGTAIVILSALINALELANKKIEEVNVVISGAGAAAIASANLICEAGVRVENVIMLDSKGVIHKKRKDLNEYKKTFATSKDVSTLKQALKGADVFIGLSKGGVLKSHDVDTMAKDAIIFAMANPEPEINPEEMSKAKNSVIYATGRSDYPNQVNNAISFPYLFKGALMVRATEINKEMMLAASRAIAKLAHEPVPEEVSKKYKSQKFSYGREYLLPKILDERLKTVVTIAVAQSAIDSGVATKLL